MTESGAEHHEQVKILNIHWPQRAVGEKLPAIRTVDYLAIWIWYFFKEKLWVSPGARANRFMRQSCPKANCWSSKIHCHSLSERLHASPLSVVREWRAWKVRNNNLRRRRGHFAGTFQLLLFNVVALHAKLRQRSVPTHKSRLFR